MFLPYHRHLVTRGCNSSLSVYCFFNISLDVRTSHLIGIQTHFTFNLCYNGLADHFRCSRCGNRSTCVESRTAATCCLLFLFVHVAEREAKRAREAEERAKKEAEEAAAAGMYILTEHDCTMTFVI